MCILLLFEGLFQDGNNEISVIKSVNFLKHSS